MRWCLPVCPSDAIRQSAEAKQAGSASTPCRVWQLAPALGAAHQDDMGGAMQVEQEDNQTGLDTGRFRHGDGIRMGGLTHSIRPGVPCPATVLVVVMSNGSYLLVGYPEGEPTAFVTSEDAGLRRQGLAVAFGSMQ